MHFGTKSYLKSTRNHTAKHTIVMVFFLNKSFVLSRTVLIQFLPQKTFQKNIFKTIKKIMFKENIFRKITKRKKDLKNKMQF
jgi:hypothetical protein